MDASTEPTTCSNESCPHRAEVAVLRNLVKGGVAALQQALVESHQVDAEQPHR